MPRQSDGLVWKRKDLAADETHPSTNNGTVKVGQMLLNFFQSDPLARTWHLSANALRKGTQSVERKR